jgi:protein-S-isoprenylcysteine O-methyltransferase Ste14
MPALGGAGRPNTIRRWLSSTPRRTFVLYPALILVAELVLRDGALVFNWEGLPLLAWGYAQYRLSGLYRTRQGGGGPGVDNPPERLVDTGVYAYIRNPMYLGHLIFMLGLIVTCSSWIALALLLFHMWWFHQRVLEDEKHMRQLFGVKFEQYARRVNRWGFF